MRPSISALLSTYIILLLFACWTAAEPVQYCRFGHSPQGATVDFCLGITTHHNATSNEYDMYLSIKVTRSSALGWTAVGTGSMMAGSLMFIIYGDPLSEQKLPPTVSIRTIDGHHQPHLLSSTDTGGADLRLLQAEWAPGTAGGDDVYIAKAAVVCYSCGKWPGTPMSANAKSQPWIWAWNDKQEFDAYSDDVHLKVHPYHATDDGWGRFYVDMARSIDKGASAPSPPVIRPGVAELGASEIPGGWSWMDSLVHVHGWVMGAAFLLVFPVGVIAMRSGISKSFQYHWILQILASILLLIGVAIGLIRAHKIDSLHHWIGVIVAICSLIQIVLGWRHHVLFVQIQRRQWASYGHIWLGRVFLLFGWTNVITGLLLTGRSFSWIAVALGLIAADAAFLVSWIWVAARRRKQRPQSEEESPLYALQSTRDDYVAVAANDVDDDYDEREARFSRDESEPVAISKKDTE
ncbi:hypothetical protein BJX68DRAFT_159211 [Aspergillus pseudodeflectus]|uniref:Cytochrome b561 domain-containing protein n=1 Tax=Aspergillus pseudodeflectus TaxID=176178 RepID=A0ABR4JS51_9EURO